MPVHSALPTAPLPQLVPSTLAGSAGKRLRLLPEHSRNAVSVRPGIARRSASESDSSRSTSPVTLSRHAPRSTSTEIGPFERMKKRSTGVRNVSSRARGDSKLVASCGIRRGSLPSASRTWSPSSRWLTLVPSPPFRT